MIRRGKKWFLLRLSWSTKLCKYKSTFFPNERWQVFFVAYFIRDKLSDETFFPFVRYFAFFYFSFSIFLSPLIIPLSMLSNFFKNGTSPPQIFPAEYFDHFTLLIQFCSGPLKNDWHFEIVQLLWTSNKEVRIVLGMIYFKIPFTQFRMEHVYFLQKEFVLSPILFKIYNKTK